MKYIKLFESFLSDYAEIGFKTTKINTNEKVGILYHGTSLSNAISILKEKNIYTPNAAYDKGLFNDRPWFKDFLPKEDDDLYGEFVYTSQTTKNGYCGVSECNVMFCIYGDKLKKYRNIYKADDKRLEGNLHMVEGSIPIHLVSEIYCWDTEHIRELKKYTRIKITKVRE